MALCSVWLQPHAVPKLTAACMAEETAAVLLLPCKCTVVRAWSYLSACVPTWLCSFIRPCVCGTPIRQHLAGSSTRSGCVQQERRVLGGWLVAWLPWVLQLPTAAQRALICANSAALVMLYPPLKCAVGMHVRGFYRSTCAYAVDCIQINILASKYPAAHKL